MNTEERQLAEMLHRVTPEPPRRVTVEDIAYRVASESHGPAGRGRRARGAGSPSAALPGAGGAGPRPWRR